MNSKALSVEIQGGALRVTLRRPPVNVLDIPTIRELHDALRPLPDRRDLKVVVLRSSIEGTFSAGVDVKDHTRERVGEMLEAFHVVLCLLDELPQVAVAAVDGRCLGGGCELAAVCDFVLATPRSTFGQPEIDVGCFPPAASVLLPRLIGRAAYEMILTGASLSAVEAARIGLITRVVDDLAAETEALLARLTSKSGAVLAVARKAMRGGPARSFADALNRTERLYREDLLKTQDVDEGVAAFLEKRPPRWKDR